MIAPPVRILYWHRVRLPFWWEFCFHHILLWFRLCRLPDQVIDLQRLLYHSVADGLELPVLFQRHTLREMVCVGAKHILPLFIPQIVQLPDVLIPGKLRYNLVDDSLHVRFEIAIHLLPRGMGKAVTELYQ